MQESDLYPAIKALLEAQGYEVKGEIGAADVVALRGDAMVIVEIKTAFSLALFHQGIARLAVTEHVYLAVPRPKGGHRGKAFRANAALCRRLGLGLITVRLRDGVAEVMLDPGPYAPRKSKAKRTRLLREFQRLEGDPNRGGQTRVGLMTAYRQDALRCAQVLADGPLKGAVVAKSSGVPNATRLMADNHYGWFERVAIGIYGLTKAGRRATARPPETGAGDQKS
ncbi:hypothetical protein FHS89_002033 [Rubricella aquisinus]|uniref:Uncharacterized protein n=1 Tax=Rubricella aquisinus TaxID=2028108 RepID=A0A840WPL5_9RHOB|nr:DUF2161 family putative PD-(D/E)XK-type phosphodiesterase [Rubricella aquisinus]MBB5516013.1 hypothetical protein [Rubricella aquisinus]